MLIAKSINDIKTHIHHYLKQVEMGEEVLIYKGGQPIARLIKDVTPPVRPKRQPGGLEGKMVMAPDFDEWPEDISRALGMID